MNPRHLLPLLLIPLLGGCATLERDKVGSREVAEKITLYLDVALIQRQDRGANTLQQQKSEPLAEAIEQRVRRRLAQKGYRLNNVVTTIGAAPNADLTATNLTPLHQAASRVARQLPAQLRQSTDSLGVMVVTIHGSLKSPLELQREQALDNLREMVGHSIDEIAQHIIEAHYRLALYQTESGELLWNNWGEDLLHDSDELLGLVEPAIGSLP